MTTHLAQTIQLLRPNSLMDDLLAAAVQNSHQISPIIYSLGMKYQPQRFENVYRTLAEARKFLSSYAINLDDFMMDGFDIPIEELGGTLQAILFDELIEVIEQAYQQLPTITVSFIVDEMSAGHAGKRQIELLASARDACATIVKYAPLYKNVLQQHKISLLNSIRKFLKYNKDFETDIKYSLPRTGHTVDPMSWLNRQKDILTSVKPLITKLCNMINRILESSEVQIDTFMGGIKHIFTRNFWYQNTLEDNLYLLAVFQLHGLIDPKCFGVLTDMFTSTMKLAMCQDDAFEECECDQLVQCGKEKLCPQSLTYLSETDRQGCKPYHM